MSVAEFTAVMKRVGRLTDGQIADMLKKADKNGDGWVVHLYYLVLTHIVCIARTLSFEEFEMMMA